MNTENKMENKLNQLTGSQIVKTLEKKLKTSKFASIEVNIPYNKLEKMQDYLSTHSHHYKRTWIQLDSYGLPEGMGAYRIIAKKFYSAAEYFRKNLVAKELANHPLVKLKAKKYPIMNLNLNIRPLL